MFNVKNSAAIYLGREKIVFANPNKQLFSELSLEKEIFNNLEIKNEENFIQIIKTFFAEFQTENGIIFLAKPVIFEREVSPDGPKATQNPEIEKFLSMIPIAKDKLGLKVLIGQDSTLCLGTNKEYYQLVIKGAELAGMKVSAVVPAFLFEGLEQNGALNAERINNALGETSLLEQSNFLNEKEGQPVFLTVEGSLQDPKAAEESSVSHNKTIILTIILVGLLSFSVIFSYMNGLFDRFFPQRIEVSKNITSVVLPSVDPTMDTTIDGQESTNSAIRMEELRAKITNGTGISGQATRAQDALAPLKMKETLLAQEATKGAVITQVGFDPRIPKDLVDQVQKTLAKTFVTVEEKEASDTGEFDFLIVTGKEKTTF